MEQIIDMGVWTYGDRFRYPRFTFLQRTYDATTDRLVTSEMNLTADYSHIKFCARHENNHKDENDHSKDDIYSDMIIDGGGKCHFEWGENDLKKLGGFLVKVEFERTDGKKFHAQVMWRFNVVPKMPGGFGTA